VYATKGYDSVDALGGSRHTYPDRTTMTLRSGGCGLVTRWSVLQERWDETESCRTRAGDEFRRFTSYHEFFRYGDLRVFACAGLIYPADVKPGMVWRNHCATSNVTSTNELHAIGWEDVLVGTTHVRAIHIRVLARLTGQQRGTSIRDGWLSDTGLRLKEAATTDADSTMPVVGRTHYHEEYELHLLSLSPQT
jgi:hypothetical protein